MMDVKEQMHTQQQLILIGACLSNLDLDGFSEILNAAEKNKHLVPKEIYDTLINNVVGLKDLVAQLKYAKKAYLNLEQILWRANEKT